MFTIKVIRASGRTEVKDCDSYVKTAISGDVMPTITLTSRGDKEKVELVAGDTVYVENSYGKTIDVIRTSTSSRKQT